MTINYKTMAPMLFSLGYEPLVIRPVSKAPIDAAWSSMPITRLSVAKRSSTAQVDSGIGIRCGTGSVAVYAADFDFYDTEVTKAVANSFFELFGKGPIRIGQKPKALAVYIGDPGQSKIQTEWTSPDGTNHKFELLGSGQQFVAYGIHPDTKKAYTWPNGGLDSKAAQELPQLDFAKVIDWVNNVLPSLLPTDWVAGSSKVKAVSNKPRDAFESYKAPLDGWDLQRVVKEILPHLDPSMGNDEWVQVGFALYHQGGGDSDWLAAFDEWSSGGSNYEDGVCEQRWPSFANEGRSGDNLVTLASLLHLTRSVRENDANGELLTTAIGYQGQIASAVDEATLRGIASNIASDKHLDALARNSLVDLWAARHKELLGGSKPPPVGIIRELLGVNTKKPALMSADMPFELRRWVYCTSIDKFFNLDTKEQISKQGFRAKFDRLFGLDDNGRPLSAFDCALASLAMPTVYKLEYAPFFGDTYTREALEFANLYRVSSTPVAAGRNLSEDDEAKIGYLMDHFVLSIPNADYRKLYLQWCAHNVVKPGVKVRWAPVEVGIEGDGKSLKGNLLRAAMGAENVGEVSSSVLTNSSFTDFAQGKAINIIEELRIQGKKRLEVMDKLKTYITNDLIEVHQKGIKALPFLNTCNYLGFSNHRDCLSLTDTDRRWMLLFTPWADIKEFEAKIRELFAVSIDTYWTRLWDVVNTCHGLCREFFERVDLSDFDPNGRAPHTIYKDMVDHPEGSSHSDAAVGLIDQGCFGVSRDVVDSASFSAAMASMSPPIILETSQVHRLLLATKKLTPLPKNGDGKRTQIFWEGKARSVWVSTQGQTVYDSEGPDGLRKLLDETKGIATWGANLEVDFLR